MTTDLAEGKLEEGLGLRLQEVRTHTDGVPIAELMKEAICLRLRKGGAWGFTFVVVKVLEGP